MGWFDTAARWGSKIFKGSDEAAGGTSGAARLYAQDEMAANLGFIDEIDDAGNVVFTARQQFVRHMATTAAAGDEGLKTVAGWRATMDELAQGYVPPPTPPGLVTRSAQVTGGALLLEEGALPIVTRVDNILPWGGEEGVLGDYDPLLLTPLSKAFYEGILGRAGDQGDAAKAISERENRIAQGIPIGSVSIEDFNAEIVLKAQTRGLGAANVIISEIPSLERYRSDLTGLVNEAIADAGDPYPPGTTAVDVMDSNSDYIERVEDRIANVLTGAGAPDYIRNLDPALQEWLGNFVDAQNDGSIPYNVMGAHNELINGLEQAPGATINAPGQRR